MAPDTSSDQHADDVRPAPPGLAPALAYWAWTIIANAHEGNWDEASPAWREAATRWRDAFHAYLDAEQYDGEACGNGS